MRQAFCQPQPFPFTARLLKTVPPGKSIGLVLGSDPRQGHYLALRHQARSFYRLSRIETWQDGSVGKGACHQASGPEFSSQVHAHRCPLLKVVL